MKARDIMVNRVPAVSASMPAVDAVRLLSEQSAEAAGFSATPGLVVLNDDGELAGIFSPLNVIKALYDYSEKSPPPTPISVDYYNALCSILAQKMVKDVMDWQPVSVTEDEPLLDVASIFITNRLQRLPVVRKNKVVGIIYRSQLMSVMAGSLL